MEQIKDTHRRYLDKFTPGITPETILKGLVKLPLPWNEAGPSTKNNNNGADPGWSLKEAIVAAKRQFTSVMFIKLNPVEWFKDVKDLAGR